MKTPDVPPRTLAALQAIRTAIREEGFPPTVRELAVRMGVRSTNGVNEHLQRLTDAGLLRRLGRGRARALALTEAGWVAVSLADAETKGAA